MDISEIEKRLEVASHYRSLLNRKLFDKTDEATEQIQSEIRSFVQERLEVLLGIRQDSPTGSDFTKAETIALRALARKIINKDTTQLTATATETPAPKQEAKVVVAPPIIDTTPAEPKRRPQKESKPKVEAKMEKDDLASRGEVGDTIMEDGRTYEIILVEGKKFAKDVTKQSGIDQVKQLSPRELANVLQMQAQQQVSAQKFDPIIEAAIQAAMRG